ncbi:hypothetical protein [Methyloglobulus sp.]|uniref:hypothetical protein n=1 Tax=Methyloglobulus sp. TaxID=2518622 RepID=UPI003989FF56
MLNNKDQEDLVNADYAANLLVQNLDSIAKSTDPLLASTAHEVLQQAMQIEQRLQRLMSVTQP